MENVEIERKFLIDGFPTDEDELEIERAFITQSYLSIHPEVRIREIVRSDFHFYYLTIKSDGDLKRTEVELEITKSQYDALNAMTCGPAITKERRIYRVMTPSISDESIYVSKYFECNHCNKETDREIRYVDVEFDSEEEAAAFVPPGWFGKEVTHDENLKNKYQSQCSE